VHGDLVGPSGLDKNSFESESGTLVGHSHLNWIQFGMINVLELAALSLTDN
jgi:hypothetical protein